MSAEREDLEYDYGADTQQAWENETRPIDRRDDVDDAGFPILGPYVFGVLMFYCLAFCEN